MKKYHGKKGEKLAYLKFMRLLLSHRIDRLVGLGCTEFTVLWDKMAVNQELEREMREILISDLARSARKYGVECSFRHLSHIDSRTLHLTQVADLMTGATGYAWDGEGGGNPEKEAARKAIRRQIEDWAGESLTYEHFPPDRYYCLWRWRPGKR